MHKTLTHESTGDSIAVTKTFDGQKNTVFVISGRIASPEDSCFEVIDLGELTGSPRSLRLDTVTFLIQNGLLCELTFIDQPYLIPLEGRGKVELDPIGGLAECRPVLTLKGVGIFFLILDISK